MSQQESLQETKDQLIRLTSEFCDQKLDEEHKELTQKLIDKLYSKTSRPFESPNLKQWASGIIHAIGSANLLFDDSFEPYISEQELLDYFEVEKYVIFRNSTFITEQLNLDIFDRDPSIRKLDDKNPLKDKVSVDGIPITIDLLSSKLQKKIRDMQAKGYQIEIRTNDK
jgi:hypothetical protein